MNVSLSVIGKLSYYHEELNRLGITLNDIGIPAIGNPNTPKDKRYEYWASKMQKNITRLVENGIQKSHILINIPINQVIYKDIKEMSKLITFVKENEISKIIIIKGNGNMGTTPISVSDFVSEFRKQTKELKIKLYVALYPSHKLAWSKEVLGKCTFLDTNHLVSQIEKVKKLNDFVDGYITQITVNGVKASQWLNKVAKNTDKPIFLGVSAPTDRKLDIRHVRTQLYYICNDEKFLLDESMFKILLRVLLKPTKWFKILRTMNLGIVDMMWRFRLTRTTSFEKLIDDLRENIIKNKKIDIHFNSGGQSPKEAMQYLRLLKRLKVASS